MGEKDLSQKQLLECEDTFSDIVNTLLLGGRRIIQPRKLKPAKRASLYKDKDPSRSASPISHRSLTRM